MTSCGYAVPTVNEEARNGNTVEASKRDNEEDIAKLSNQSGKCLEDRHLLEKWLVNKIDKKSLDQYVATFNTKSLDGLPGLRIARKWNGERYLWIEDARFWMKKKFGYPEAILLGIFIGACLVMLAPIVVNAALIYIPEQLKGQQYTLQMQMALFTWIRMLKYKLSLIWRILILHMHSFYSG